MPLNSKFRINRTRWSRIFVCILNFVKFRRFAAEIWRYNNFQNGGRPPCSIFEIWHFHHPAFMCVRLCLLIPNFVLIGQYGAELQSKMFFNMASVRNLDCEFLNFCHVSVALLNICVCIPDFVKFGWFAAEIWSYNDFQNGDRPPCWIFEIWHFHHQTFICVRLRFRSPNFVLIGQ